MQIIFLTRRFLPDVGGVERHILEISKRFQKKSLDLIIIADKAGKNFKDKEIIQNFKVIRLDSSKNKIKGIGLIKIWLWLWENKNLLKQTDLIHIHDVFIWFLPLKFIFLCKPVFLTFHGYESYPIRKRAILIRKISELLSWGNICIGDFIRKWYSTKPNYVIYGGVDFVKFKSTRTKNKFDAVFSSRLDEQSGITEYLEAVKILKKRGIIFKLAVLGDGKYKKQADKVATTFGFVKDPSPYFRQSRFAFVSRYLAILEAMACKKLVFATYDNPLKEDYLRMTPFAKWIIIEKDPRKLADRVEYYIKHPKEEKKLTEPAYRWAVKQTWDKVVDVYIKLWKQGGVNIPKS